MATLDMKRLAMIGGGSMGGGMALLFAENGYEVGLSDPSQEAMDKVLESAKESKLEDKVKTFSDYASLCEWLDPTKVFVWSLPHGSVGDKVLDGLMPFLKKDDIIIDAANEHWQNSERRQGKCNPKGIRYVAMGVSGGYQAARRGPSICPSSSENSALDLVLPHLQKIAAKDAEGQPCAQKIGTGSAGHYVKMIHNGIEHGMMAAISEAWSIMHRGLQMSNDEISKELYRWNEDGELRNTFLVRIGGDITATRDEKGEKVLDTLEDKVTQDVTGEEGTGVWSNEESVHEHIPAPTLAVAHYLRIASSDLAQRRKIKSNFDFDFPPQVLDVDKTSFLESLRLATYAGCLASYIEGMLVISRADKEKRFNIDYKNVLKIWHAGCIIQSDYICRDLLEPIYAREGAVNPLYEPSIAREFKKSCSALKKVVLAAMAGDHVVPTLSATLEYLKIQTSTDLPTSFYEAELDYFGNHCFDKKGDDPSGSPVTGKFSYEWKSA